MLFIYLQSKVVALEDCTIHIDIYNMQNARVKLCKGLIVLHLATAVSFTSVISLQQALHQSYLML